jgi:hypothetical protein
LSRIRESLATTKADLAQAKAAALTLEELLEKVKGERDEDRKVYENSREAMLGSDKSLRRWHVWRFRQYKLKAEARIA